MSPWVPSHHLTSTDDTFPNSTSDDFKNTSSLIRCLVYIYFHQCKNLRLNLGGGDWNRTSDTQIFSLVLYQLSYSTINFHIVKDLFWWREVELDHWHPGLQPGALPLSYLSINLCGWRESNPYTISDTWFWTKRGYHYTTSASCRALYIAYSKHALFQPHWTPFLTLPYPSAGIIVRFCFALCEVLVGFSLHFFVLGDGFEPTSDAWKTPCLTN